MIQPGQNVSWQDKGYRGRGHVLYSRPCKYPVGDGWGVLCRVWEHPMRTRLIWEADLTLELGTTDLRTHGMFLWGDRPADCKVDVSPAACYAAACGVRCAEKNA